MYLVPNESTAVYILTNYLTFGVPFNNETKQTNLLC